MMSILEFAAHNGVVLSPVQTIALKCLYGIPLDPSIHFVVCDWSAHSNTRYSEVSYLEMLHRTGRSSTPHIHSQPRQVWLSAGRRSGKTLLESLIAAWELYRLSLGLGSVQQIQVLSTSKASAQYVMRTIQSLDKGFVGEPVRKGKGVLAYRGVERGEIELRSSYQGSLRGTLHEASILDEFAFWPQEADRLAAILPMSCLGRLFVFSSPKNESLFNRKVRELSELQDPSALALRLHTWELNPRVQVENWDTFLDDLKG